MLLQALGKSSASPLMEEWANIKTFSEIGVKVRKRERGREWACNFEIGVLQMFNINTSWYSKTKAKKVLWYVRECSRTRLIASYRSQELSNNCRIRLCEETPSESRIPHVIFVEALLLFPYLLLARTGDYLWRFLHDSHVFREWLRSLTALSAH